MIDGGVPDWARAADPDDRLGEPDPVATPTESTWDEDRQAWVFIDPIRGLFVHDTATDSWQRVPGVEPTGDPVTNSPAAVPAVFAAQPVAAATGRSVEIAPSHTAPEQAFAATVMQADPIEPSMNPHWDEQRNAWAFYAPDGQLLLHDAVANQWVPAEH